MSEEKYFEYLEKQPAQAEGECVNKYSCKLCGSNNKFWFEKKAHHHVYNVHVKPKVIDKGFTMLLCKKNDENCLQKGHYHCYSCCKSFPKDRFLDHLRVLKCKKVNESPADGSSVTTEETTSDTKVNVNVNCHICDKNMLRKNLKRHILERHNPVKVAKINPRRFLDGICIDRNSGIYMVSEFIRGFHYPIHVQKYTSTLGKQELNCESKLCVNLRNVSSRSCLPSFECDHLESIKYITDVAGFVFLNLETLGNLVTTKRITQERRNMAKTCYDRALVVNTPLAVAWKPPLYKNQRYIFISIWTGIIECYSPTGRVRVMFDQVNALFNCGCKVKTCVHITIAKWYLAETEPDIFQKSKTVDVLDEHDDSDLPVDVDVHFEKECPADDAIKTRTEYFFKNKKIPFDIPKSVLSSVFNDVKDLKPSETSCHFCSGNVELVYVIKKNKGVIITSRNLFKNINVYTKVCPRCSFEYWMQEFKSGLLNFDNSNFISIEFLLMLRNAIYSHTAISRILTILEATHDLHFNSSLIMKAYFMFDALLSDSHEYTCYLCGDHPAILNFDVNRNAAFRMHNVVNDNVNEEYVNADDFWNDVFHSAIAEGVRGNADNPYNVNVSISKWAPWISKKTRDNDLVVNTEFMKCSANTADIESQMLHNLSEERLEELLYRGSKQDLVDLCKDCGINATGCTKMGCITALKSALEANAKIDKFFFKIWASSGGVMTATCPHGIVYMLKWLLKAESPRDIADLLFSMKHAPNVVISDVPHMLSAHANKRVPSFFNPNGGRVFPPTEDHLKMLEDGTLQPASFFWLENINLPLSSPLPLLGMEMVHPITLTQLRYSLYDRFHEGNTTQRKEKLRSTKLVKELRGHINTETSEQTNETISKDLYFLNGMTPVHHIQMMRGIAGHRNIVRNVTFLEKVKDNFDQYQTSFDLFGRIKVYNPNSRLEEIVSQTQIQQRNGHIFPHANKLFWSTVPCSDDIDFTGNPLPIDSLVQLTREDLETLQGSRNIDGNVIDSFLLMIATFCAEIGVKAYILPYHFLTSVYRDVSQENLLPDSFEEYHCVFCVSSLPGHWCLTGIDLRNNFIYYLNSLGDEDLTDEMLHHVKILKSIVWHLILKKPLSEVDESIIDFGWVLVTCNNFGDYFHKPLPLQTSGSDCGIFILMYAWYLMEYKAFDFTLNDMPQLRSWFYKQLLETCSTPQFASIVESIKCKEGWELQLGVTDENSVGEIECSLPSEVDGLPQNVDMTNESLIDLPSTPILVNCHTPELDISSDIFSDTNSDMNSDTEDTILVDRSVVNFAETMYNNGELKKYVNSDKFLSDSKVFSVSRGDMSEIKKMLKYSVSEKTSQCMIKKLQSWFPKIFRIGNSDSLNCLLSVQHYIFQRYQRYRDAV